MQRRERIALQKICSEIGLALKFLGDENLEEFLADEKTKHAVGMAAINIGELTKHLSAELRQEYPEIAWKKAAAFRDVVAHKYETLNMSDVFDTVTNNFPEMKLQIEKILKMFTTKSWIKNWCMACFLLDKSGGENIINFEGNFKSVWGDKFCMKIIKEGF